MMPVLEKMTRNIDLLRREMGLASSSYGKCAYATYRATDDLDDARRDIERRERDKAVRMLEKAISDMVDVEGVCKVDLAETRVLVDVTIDAVKVGDWGEATRLVKLAEDDFEHKLLEASVKEK